MKVISLCSGGVDSIVLTTALANRPDIEEVIPVYISFRQGGGKEAKETEVMQKLLIHPKIKPFHILRGKQYHIAKEDYGNRNVQLLKFGEWCAESLDYTAISLGTCSGYNDYADRDNIASNEDDPIYLQSQIKPKLFTLDDFNVKSKVDVINLGYDLLGDRLFETTSCQLWYKMDCGSCYSDVERYTAFKLSKYGCDKTIYKRSPELSDHYPYFYNQFAKHGYEAKPRDLNV